MLAVKEIVHLSMGGHGTQNHGKEPKNRPKAQGEAIGCGSH